MNATDIVAIVTAVAATLTVGISLISLQNARDSLRTARAAEAVARDADRHERMPVLVCPASNGTTTISNVGKGPALNIVIARADGGVTACDARDVSFAQLAQATWSDAMHLQPMESGETRVYEWSGQPAFGLSYTDALGIPYTTLASRYGTKVFDGNAMSGVSMSGLAYPRRLS
jgi:hypothetical protein